MSEYLPPLKDMRFVLEELAPLNELAALPGREDNNLELAAAILEEAGKFAAGVLSPLNVIGDRKGARWDDGNVLTTPGWREAYRQFVEAGWNALSCPPEYGGQGLPRLVSALVEEMWNGANVSFALCPMLTRGAIEALDLRGSDAQKHTYLPKLISGEWTGTMNLTEPQAGSDLSAVRTRAIPQPDGSYRLHGQKIFITYGEHDLTDNIVHLVLARKPDAPEGVKGISLFVVPKHIVDADGKSNSRNDVRCVSIEHKLGIHGSPTAVLAFGDYEGAIGWLVGEENRGLETMFVMMNAARFSVGLEGVGLAERATQRAVAYAKTRMQGAELGRGRDKVAIVRHPDVRRMLMLMKARTESLRAVACTVALSMDMAQGHPEAEVRVREQAFVDLMIPVVKGWSTESAVEIASLGVQVHGGMGYVEETGAAQHLRDARITPIYEGTTGIQAADLIGRKVARDGGAALNAVLVRMRDAQTAIAQQDDECLVGIGVALDEGIDALERAARFIVDSSEGERLRTASVGSVPFLELFGIVAGGWQMALAALAALRRLSEGGGDAAFHTAKIQTASFYAVHMLSRAAGLSRVVVRGGGAALDIDEDQL